MHRERLLVKTFSTKFTAVGVFVFVEARERSMTDHNVIVDAPTYSLRQLCCGCRFRDKGSFTRKERAVVLGSFYSVQHFFFIDEHANWATIVVQSVFRTFDGHVSKQDFLKHFSIIYRVTIYFQFYRHFF